MLQHTKFETENLLDLGGYMNGAYYTTDDACKIANYDKLLEENKKLKEELYSKNNKQISMEEY